MLRTRTAGKRVAGKVVRLVILATTGLALLTGCPSPEPKKNGDDGPKTPEIEMGEEAKKDDAAAVEALKGAGATQST